MGAALNSCRLMLPRGACETLSYVWLLAIVFLWRLYAAFGFGDCWVSEFLSGLQTSPMPSGQLLSLLL